MSLDGVNAAKNTVPIYETEEQFSTTKNISAESESSVFGYGFKDGQTDNESCDDTQIPESQLSEVTVEAGKKDKSAGTVLKDAAKHAALDSIPGFGLYRQVKGIIHAIKHISDNNTKDVENDNSMNTAIEPWHDENDGEISQPVIETKSEEYDKKGNLTASNYYD